MFFLLLLETLFFLIKNVGQFIFFLLYGCGIYVLVYTCFRVLFISRGQWAEFQVFEQNEQMQLESQSSYFLMLPKY